jgi:hydroxyethylthiazole kinase-like uncharacterized protein yjeF
MRPVVTTEQMRRADAAALEHVDHATLVDRAGRAVALGALRMLGGGYGHRVVVVAGKGNNGADGKVAARVLSRRGAKVTVVDAAAPGSLQPCDLVIDAAYGTGFSGTYDAPRIPIGAKVLAVDIPSGVNGDDGTTPGRPMTATRTVTMAALKPGLLQGDGATLCGRVEVADIGIEIRDFDIGLIEDGDVASDLPRRGAAAHKWSSALVVVAGSPGMEGAATLCSRGASHAGAGMVRLAVPGSEGDAGEANVRWPLEAVRLGLPEKGWADDVLDELDRCRALVIGPGLGRAESTAAEVRRLIELAPVPVVADADALYALGRAEEIADLAARRSQPLILTPHDGEYRQLCGAVPGADRIGAARDLAERSGAIVLLKGSLTVVAAPGHLHDDDPVSVLLAGAGSPRLATAGTGDVLSGVIGAFVARGLPSNRAAALAAHVHGRAAGEGPAEGLVAGDLPDLVARWLTEELGDG